MQQGEAAISGWIFFDNLKPFAEMLANFAGYEFDDLDWTAISYGIKDTDDHNDRWLTYPLEGTQPLVLRAAIVLGSSVVTVHVQGQHGLLPAEMQTQIAVLMEVCRNYNVTSRS